MARADVDVLVIGSGASGLAAAVSAGRAGARVALATKGSIQACNSAKAQGGIQAAFGEDDSPDQHAADVWKSSHESANMELVRALTADGFSLGAGQNLGDVGRLDAAVIGLQGFADGALVDIGRRHIERQARGVEHLPARAAAGGQNETAAFCLSHRWSPHCRRASRDYGAA